VKIGIVSDIHGNVAALAHAFELMDPIDRLFALGDSIDEFRFSTPVVAMLRARDALAIRGNHEHVFFDGPGAAARRDRVEDRAHADWLASRPSRAELELMGKRLLLVHATPWGSWDYVPPHHPSFERFGETGADIVCYGHTHEPAVQRVGPTLVINPGSVGVGRPSEDGFVQSCAVLDVVAGEARILDFRI
jgi:putative phosphoesterase